MEQISTELMTNRVKKFALENGDSLIGISPVRRFEGAPRGHHPTDFLPDVKSVIVIALRILESHGPTSDLLSMLALRIAMILQEDGFGQFVFGL